MGVWSGTVPTFAAGAKLRGVDMQTLADIATAESAAMTSYTATVANLTVGSGTLTTKYRQVGKKFDLEFSFTYGAGSAVGTGPSFDLPSGLTLAGSIPASAVIGSAVYLLDSGTTIAFGFVEVVDSNTLRIGYPLAGPPGNITATAPWTWASGDKMYWRGAGLELA